MARIRSIKPEFWSDKKIADLPKATALFFIALWNFADDQGIFETDSRALSLQVPMYRSQDIHKMLNALWKAGLIKRSPIDGIALISGWKHQKIDKARDGKWKNREIKWLEWSDSTNGSESSSNIRRKDRIGSDKIGSDRMVATGVAALEPVGPSVVSQTWQAYEEEYERRYRVKPTRNAKVMGQVTQFCKRVPAAEAPSIVRFFLSHPKSFYVQKLHEFGLCLADAESLRTQFLAQTTVTDSMLSEYRRRATETRTRGIAEILADKEKNQPQLISRKVANDAE